MDSTEKSLNKLLSVIETFSSDNLSIKASIHGLKNSLNCFEILFSNKVKNDNNFACMFYFDCNSAKIYLEDYGTIYTGKNVTSDEVKTLFKKTLSTVKEILKKIPEVSFTVIQTTSRIPEKFALLQDVGFIKKEQLNHYENFKFVLPL